MAVASEDINNFIIDPFLPVKLQLSQLALTPEDIASATENEPELKMLHKNILLDSNKYARYWINDGCIIFGKRVWIPKMLQKHVLEYLHIEHVGVIKTIALALSYCVYWPSIDEDIANLARKCRQCIEKRLAPSKNIVHNWLEAKEPWERIHIDYAGPFMGNLFLLVVDEYSMWPEVFISKSSCASNTIEHLNICYSRYGHPKVLVSDNISSFKKKKFQTFLKRTGTKHCTSVPHDVKSYDNVVRFIFALKHALIELNGQVCSVEDKLSTLLFTCRRSQIASTKKSPANLFLGPGLNSNPAFQINMEDATPSPLFHFGQKVAVNNDEDGFIINADDSKYLTVMVNGRLIRHEIDNVIPLPVFKSFSKIQTDTQPARPQKLKRSIKPIKRLNL